MKKYLKFKNKVSLPVIIQIEDLSLFSDLESLFGTLGLSEIVSENIKDIKVTRDRSTIVSLSYASASLKSKMSNSSETGEVTYMPGSQFLYKNTSCCALLYSKHSVYWQMSIIKDANEDDLKVSFNRMLSLALAKVGVIGFWGVKAQDTLLVASMKVSNGDCWFLDYNNKKIYDAHDSYDLSSEYHIGRLDNSITRQKEVFSKEDLYSFLMTNNTHFSLEGINKLQKECVLRSSFEFSYIIYPEADFEQEARDVWSPNDHEGEVAA